MVVWMEHQAAPSPHLPALGRWGEALHAGESQHVAVLASSPLAVFNMSSHVGGCCTPPAKTNVKRGGNEPWLVWLSLTLCTVHPKVAAASIPGPDTYLGCGFREYTGGNLSMFFSDINVSLSPPALSPLSKISKKKPQKTLR